MTEQHLPELVARRGITDAQWRTLSNNLFPGAKEASILMVWDYCVARKLDPMKKPCHIVPMNVKDSNTGEYRYRDVVMPGIYEYRTTAQRTGEYLGHSPPEYGPLVQYKGVMAPEWCSMTIYRWNSAAKERCEYPVRVYFAEIAATKKDGSLNERWSKAPIQMLTKCFDEKTEVLTEEGFQRFSEVDSARILQVTAEGRLEPVVAQPFVQDYTGPMVAMESDDLNFCVTPNHDMVTTQGKIEAGAMFDQSRARPKFWITRALTGSHIEAPVKDDTLRLTAAYLADGSDHSGGAGNSFSIEVSRPRKVAALQKLALHSSETVCARAGEVAKTTAREIVTKTNQTRFSYKMDQVEPLSGKGKTVDLAFLARLSRRQSRIFVDALIDFDGRIDPTSNVRRFFTSRESHLHAFEIACVTAGYSVNVPKARFSDISTKPNWSITISNRDAIPVRRVGRKYHITVGQQEARTCLELLPNSTGRVWCVTVPSGVIVVRRSGFSMLCGNCTEAAGLREAFPEELGGLHTVEEMDGRIIGVNGRGDTEARDAYVKKFRDALDSDLADDVAAIHEALNREDQDLYRSVWTQIHSTDRRNIKAMIAKARGASKTAAYLEAATGQKAALPPEKDPEHAGFFEPEPQG